MRQTQQSLMQLSINSLKAESFPAGEKTQAQTGDALEWPLLSSRLYHCLFFLTQNYTLNIEMTQ